MLCEFPAPQVETGHEILCLPVQSWLFLGYDGVMKEPPCCDIIKEIFTRGRHADREGSKLREHSSNAFRRDVTRVVRYKIFDTDLPLHTADSRFEAALTFCSHFLCAVLIEAWILVSRNEANIAYRPSMAVAYTNDGYLRDAYR
jgi:hypothetical protein